MKSIAMIGNDRSELDIILIVNVIHVGFVTGNPRVGYFNTVPVTREPAPEAVAGIHRTRSPQVSLRCDDNPLRV